MSASTSSWRRVIAAVPMTAALVGVGAVWALGCVWSFTEQSRFAGAKGFELPWLLPLVIDGLAAAMAGVAYAAALDGRAAVSARLGTAIAVAVSALSNGAWASMRTGADVGAVALAVGVPIAANVAFEVLLGELRRQIHRRRGQPAPVAVPNPRMVRVLLAPLSTVRQWRAVVLELTALVPSPVPSPVPSSAPASTRPPPPRPRAVRPALPAGGAGRGGRAHDERVLQLVPRVAGGERLTGAEAAALFGCTERTGRRLLERAREITERTPQLAVGT